MGWRGIFLAPKEEKEWQIAENSSPFSRFWRMYVSLYFKKNLTGNSPLVVDFFHCVFIDSVSPFDVIDSMTTPNMSQEQIDLLKVKYGLDQPFLVQYFVWLKGILSGNLGFSLMTQHSIGADLAEKIPNTILVLPAYLTALVLAITLGLVSASQRGKWVDKVIDAFASVGIAVPTFWFAMILIYFFGYKWRVFPFIGMYTLGKEEMFLIF